LAKLARESAPCGIAATASEAKAAEVKCWREGLCAFVREVLVKDVLVNPETGAPLEWHPAEQRFSREALRRRMPLHGCCTRELI